MTGLKVNGVPKLNQSSSNATSSLETVNASESIQKNNLVSAENKPKPDNQLPKSAVLPELSDKKVSNSEEKKAGISKEASNQQIDTQNSTSANSIDNEVATGAEIGLMFVKQYYALMNFSPKYLHCFYKKSSTMIHGSENQDVKPQVGQREIHSHFMQYNFKNCKVVVSNVDCQASLFGSYVIVVIGVLSNNDESPKRFSQTFVLCKQDAGFYILNDIFRFLKDDLDSKEQDVDLVEVKIEDGEFKIVDVRDSQTTNNSQNPSISKTSEPTVTKNEVLTEQSTSTDDNTSCIETPKKENGSFASPKVKRETNKAKSQKVASEKPPSKTNNNLKSGLSPKITAENPSEPSTALTLDKASKNIASQDTSKHLDINSDKKSNLDENKNLKNPDRNGSTNPRRESPDYSASLCVKFIKEGTSEVDIISVFQVFGKVRSVEFRNQVVFVNFESADSRTKALNHGKIFICDESVKVEPRRQQFNSNRSSHHNRSPFRGTKSRASNQKPSSPST